MESPSHRNTCHRSSAPFCIVNWKESSGRDTTFFPEEESMVKEEPAHQRRMLGWWEENIDGKDTIKKELQESRKEDVSPPEQLSDKPLVVPHEEPFVEMGESLLDCIIKEPPIKVVSYFLTQAHGSLFRIYPGFGTGKQFSGEDNLNSASKTPTPEEVMVRFHAAWMMKIPLSDKASSSALNNMYIAIFYMWVLGLPDV